VNRKIIDFGQDDEDDWFARLDCGHNQHVRHRPPFVERPWVEDGAERTRRIGSALDCRLCDRLEAPEGLTEYRSTPEFTSETVPAGLLRDHATKAGTWGRIEILAGEVTYVTAAPSAQTLRLSTGKRAMIPPELLHHVVPSEDARFRVVFLRLEA
jgi:tellurite methyltransferase